MYNESAFCPCCGMQLRPTPTSRECLRKYLEREKLMEIYGP